MRVLIGLVGRSMVMAKRNSNTVCTMNSLSQIVLATLCIYYDDFKNNRPILLVLGIVQSWEYDAPRPALRLNTPCKTRSSQAHFFFTTRLAI